MTQHEKENSNCADQHPLTEMIVSTNLSWQTAKEDKPHNKKTASVPIIGKITSVQCTVPP